MEKGCTPLHSRDYAYYVNLNIIKTRIINFLECCARETRRKWSSDEQINVSKSAKFQAKLYFLFDTSKPSVEFELREMIEYLF